MDWSRAELLMDFYQLLFWRHPFTAKHPLVSKWHDSLKKDSERTKLIYILDGLRVNSQQIFIFVWFKNTILKLNFLLILE